MATQQEKDKAWGRCIAIRKEIEEARAEIQRTRCSPDRYYRLVKDEQRLKAEYEAVIKLGTFNPLSVKDGEKMQSEKIVGDLMGRNGDDTHFGVGGNQDRRGK